MESRVEQAVAKKQSGKYNCAQAVACTYADIAGVDEEMMRNLSHAFGSGMGSMDGTCGSIVGAGMVISMAHRDRAAASRDMRELITRFKECNGAVSCRELKGIETGKPLRGCLDCVADSCRIVESLLGDRIK